MSQENVEIVEAAIAAISHRRRGGRARAGRPGPCRLDIRPDRRPDDLTTTATRGCCGPPPSGSEAWTEHSFEVVRAWDARDFVLFALGSRGGWHQDSGVPMETETTIPDYTLSERRLFVVQIFRV